MITICERDGVLELEKLVGFGWNELCSLEVDNYELLIKYHHYNDDDDIYEITYYNNSNNDDDDHTIRYGKFGDEHERYYSYFSDNEPLISKFKTLINKIESLKCGNTYLLSEIVFITDAVRKHMKTIIHDYNDFIEQLNNREISFGSSVKRATTFTG